MCRGFLYESIKSRPGRREDPEEKKKVPKPGRLGEARQDSPVLTSIAMSRFTSLLKHAGELAPQTKEILKEAGEKLQAARNSPNPNIQEMQRLSDLIKNTTEANVPRQGAMQGPERLRTTNQPQITKSDSGNILIPGEGKSAADLLQESRKVKAGDVLKEGFQDPIQRDLKRLNDYDAMTKKSIQPDFSKPQTLLPRDAQVLAKEQRVAAMAAGPPEWRNEDGSFKDPIQELGVATGKTGKKLVDRFMADSSPENKALAQKTFEVVANPTNLIGGAGLADLALGAVEVAPEAYEAGKARFKELFGK